MLEIREFFSQYAILKKLVIGVVLVSMLAVPLITTVGWAVLRTTPYRLVREAMRYEAEFSTRNFKELEGEHFIVRYQPIDADIAPLVLQVAEESYDPVVQSWGRQENRKILVVVYPNEREMIRGLRWPLEKSPMGAYQGGVIKILSPYLWVEQGQDMDWAFRKTGPITHEFTHLVVDYQTDGNHARWFTEGLAQYMEVRQGGFLWFGYRDFSVEEAYPMDQLEQKFDDTDDQALAYWQAYAIMGYFVDTYGETGVRQVMAELKAGASMEQAIQKVTGKNYSAFEAGWRQWMKEREQESGTGDRKNL